MTKKKKSILSDQRFIVLLVIIALSAIFSFMSKEFRQYTAYHRRCRPVNRNWYGMLRIDRRNTCKKQ